MYQQFSTDNTYTSNIDNTCTVNSSVNTNTATASSSAVLTDTCTSSSITTIHVPAVQYRQYTFQQFSTDNTRTSSSVLTIHVPAVQYGVNTCTTDNTCSSSSGPTIHISAVQNRQYMYQQFSSTDNTNVSLTEQY